jgi:hypothetical protein
MGLKGRTPAVHADGGKRKGTQNSMAHKEILLIYCTFHFTSLHGHKKIFSPPLANFYVHLQNMVNIVPFLCPSFLTKKSLPSPQIVRVP